MRPYQRDFVEDALRVLREGGILLAHAPTGMGKTDASLAAALTVAEEEGLDVFFATPKIAQHFMALHVVKGIVEKHSLPFRGADIIGRKYMCIHPVLSREEDKEGFYMACERLRRKDSCPYHTRAFLKQGEEAYKGIGGPVVPHTVALERGRAWSVCPYELSLKALRDSNVLVVDYFHVFIKRVREPFLAKLRKSFERAILIVDEAHNVPRRVREQLSATLTEGIVKKAEREARLLGYKANLLKGFQQLANVERERVMEKEELYEAFSSPRELAEELEEVGEEWMESTGEKSKAMKVAYFLKKWEEAGEGYARILKKGKISLKALDPAIGTSIVNAFRGAVLMSGTLKPLPMYADVMGLDLEKVEMRAYPSPFPAGNKRGVIVRGLTSTYRKRGEEMWRKYGEVIDRIYAHSPKGVAVFFASYKVMDGVLPFIRSRPRYVQRKGAKPEDTAALLQRFRERPGLLLAVQGGSLAEGVDFSQGEIKTVVLAGLALDEMSLEVKELIAYYDRKFGKGMEYGYHYPAMVKALQAIGRAIRKERDRAFVVLLDERFGWRNFRKLLDFPVEEVDDPVEELRAFWKGENVGGSVNA